MAAGDTDIGTGTTLTFAGFTGDLISVAWSGIERPSIDTTHMGTTGGRTFIPGDLYDPGEVVAEVFLDFTEDLVIDGAAATLTVAFPQSTTSTEWTCSAFMTGFEMNDPLEDAMTATATFKCTGNGGFT